MSKDLTTAVAQLPVSLDSNLSLDDVVNVFIARHEDELVGKVRDIQHLIKDLVASRKTIFDLLIKTHLDKVSAAFPALVVASPLVEVAYSVKHNENGDAYYAGAGLLFNLSIETTLAKTGSIHITHYGSGEKYTITTTEVIRSVPTEAEVADIKGLDDKIAEQRQTLLSLNGELQQMDRKARRIKGVLAQKKLEQAGLTDLLESVEIQQILQIGN